jgi:hypothetical protein
MLDLEGSAKTEAELVTKYRESALFPELDDAITDIINEAIIIDPAEPVVKINLDNVPGLGNNGKKAIEAEFSQVLDLLEFNAQGYDVFKRWYVDGRLYYHAIIDRKNPKAGITELRYIDPRKIRKIRQIKRENDKLQQTNAAAIKVTKEYYIYNERGFNVQGVQMGAGQVIGLKIAKDSIVYVTSGITDPNNSVVLSHLHKIIKVLNQLRAIEDALVIYRLNRSVDRRVFYIDVGNLPKLKAEQYLREIMAKFKNRMVYDSHTGEVRDERKFQTMLEDFWLPRREGQRGTQIETLKGGEHLNDIADIDYFKQKLYRSLNVPITRMTSENGFNLGKSSEITRDEIKFAKFIKRIRAKFSQLFLKILEKQVVLKGIMSIEEWDMFAPKITFDFQNDNEYALLKELEVLGYKLDTLSKVVPYVGQFFSMTWCKKRILGWTEEEIEDMMEEIEAEMKAGLIQLPASQDTGLSSGDTTDDSSVPSADSTRYFG